MAYEVIYQDFPIHMSWNNNLINKYQPWVTTSEAI